VRRIVRVLAARKVERLKIATVLMNASAVRVLARRRRNVAAAAAAAVKRRRRAAMMRKRNAARRNARRNASVNVVASVAVLA